MTECPCGSDQAYDACCEPYIRGTKPAPTAESLMRARYSAHVQEEVDFILETVLPEQQDPEERESVERWSKESFWRGIKILGTEGGGEEDDTGKVEFIASYTEGERDQEHHEIAAFQRKDGKWYFDVQRTSVPRTEPLKSTKVGRNDPCPCGSGKKYKKCCA